MAVRRSLDAVEHDGASAVVDAREPVLDRLAEAVDRLSDEEQPRGMHQAAELIAGLPGVAGVTIEHAGGVLTVGETGSPCQALDLAVGTGTEGRLLVFGDESAQSGTVGSALTVFASALTGVLRQERVLTALREREEHAGAVVATSLDPIVTMDAHGLVRAFNPAAERTFGHQAEDVVGRRLGDVLVPERLREAHAAGLRRYLGTGRSDLLGHRVEMPAVCVDGREITVELAIVPTSADGETVFTGFMRDITEQARVQRRLEDTTSRLRTMIAAMHAAVLVEDENRRIVVTNQAFTDMFEIPAAPERLLGADCSRAAEQASGLFENPEGFITSVERALAGRVPVISEELAMRDGRVLERDYVPVFRGEEYVGHLWAYRDVTARKQSERRLVEQNQMLAEIADMKDRFLAAVSHELRTPLTSVISFAEILGEPESGDLTAPQRQYLEVVQRNAAHLMRLVEDILTLMRAETDELSVELATFDAAGLLREVAVEHGRRAVDRRVHLSLDAPAQLLVQADAARLRQVLDNLVGNAVKFTPADGEVVVSAEPGEDSWTLRVSDTGIGVPAVDQERLFTSFFRASNAASGLTPGTGLGLVVSRAIVELHGGTIALESAEGSGTTVTVTLPLRPAGTGTGTGGMTA